MRGKHRQEWCDYSSQVWGGRAATSRVAKYEENQQKRHGHVSLAGMRWEGQIHKGEKPERERGKELVQIVDRHGAERIHSELQKSPHFFEGFQETLYFNSVLMDLVTGSPAAFPYNAMCEGSTAGTQLPQTGSVVVPTALQGHGNFNRLLR